MPAMPIYEYHCQTCGKKSSIFFRTFSAVGAARCSHCDGDKIDRLVSKVSILKSWGSSLDWMPSTESLYDVDEDDPQAMEGWLERTRRQQGADLGDSFADTMAKMDAGIEPPWFEHDHGGESPHEE